MKISNTHEDALRRIAAIANGSIEDTMGAILRQVEAAMAVDVHHDDMAELRDRHADWSQRQFGDVSAVGPAKHLAKEALEVAAAPHDPIEHADCWMLLWDMQRRAGISDGMLAEAIRQKLDINMARLWPAPQEGEPREHDRAADEVPWKWWAGSDEELFQIGPCSSREEAIREAVSDGLCEQAIRQAVLDGVDEAPTEDNPEAYEHQIYLIEAQQAPLRLADWIGANDALEKAEEWVADSDRATEYDEGPWFEATPEQEADLVARLRRACDEWQAAHGLTFTAFSFSATRTRDYVVVPAGSSEPPAEGGDA